MCEKLPKGIDLYFLEDFEEELEKNGFIPIWGLTLEEELRSFAKWVLGHRSEIRLSAFKHGLQYSAEELIEWAERCIECKTNTAVT